MKIDLELERWLSTEEHCLLCLRSLLQLQCLEIPHLLLVLCGARHASGAQAYRGKKCAHTVKERTTLASNSNVEHELKIKLKKMARESIKTPVVASKAQPGLRWREKDEQGAWWLLPIKTGSSSAQMKLCSQSLLRKDSQAWSWVRLNWPESQIVCQSKMSRSKGSQSCLSPTLPSLHYSWLCFCGYHWRTFDFERGWQVICSWGTIDLLLKSCRREEIIPDRPTCPSHLLADYQFFFTFPLVCLPGLWES